MTLADESSKKSASYIYLFFLIVQLSAHPDKLKLLLPPAPEAQ